MYLHSGLFREPVILLKYQLDLGWISALKIYYFLIFHFFLKFHSVYLLKLVFSDIIAVKQSLSVSVAACNTGSSLTFYFPPAFLFTVSLLLPPLPSHPFFSDLCISSLSCWFIFTYFCKGDLAHSSEAVGRVNSGWWIALLVSHPSVFQGDA